MFATTTAGSPGRITLAANVRRRHPRVDLAGLEAGIHGGEAGILHRLQVQGVDDVGLLDGALDDADTLPGGAGR